MTDYEMNIKDLLLQLNETVAGFVEAILLFSEKEMNTVPFEGSWTAAQVADHVTRSNTSIAKALQLNGTPINREPDERADELRNIFLNFTVKLKSPSFILPAQAVYDKATLLARLEHSIGKIKELSGQTDLSAMINHPAFGDITKLEILHFVVYHTQRHTHQLKNIYVTLNKTK